MLVILFFGALVLGQKIVFFGIVLVVVGEHPSLCLVLIRIGGLILEILLIEAAAFRFGISFKWSIGIPKDIGAVDNFDVGQHLKQHILIIFVPANGVSTDFQLF